MKKRFISSCLALLIAMTQVCPSFGETINNIDEDHSLNSSIEEEKKEEKSSTSSKDQEVNQDAILEKEDKVERNDLITSSKESKMASEKSLPEDNEEVKSGNIYSSEDDKLSPLLQKLKNDVKGDEIEVEKVVYFVEYEKADDRESVLEAIKEIEDTKVLYEYTIIFQGVSVETWPKNLDKLKLIKGVKSVERAGKLKPLMNNARKIIGVDEASNYLKAISAENPEIGSNYDGRGMVISHIDTGLDYRHRAMKIDKDAEPMMKIKNDGKDPFWVSNKVPHAFNYMNGGKDTIEKYDDGSAYYDPHGMHIAGILAANDDENLVKENKGIKGIAPNAQILSYKMYSDSSDAFAGDETMFHAFEDSIKHGADVVSISSGFTGTGLVGEKYWPAIRAMRKAGIPVFVATGNFATSASNSSWDKYANNALGMTDTGNVTRTAAHEDAIGVGSSRNTVVNFPEIKIGPIKTKANSNTWKSFRYSQIGAFFDKNRFFDKKTNINGGKYTFIYLGRCQDEDIGGYDLRDKIVVMDRIYTGDLKYAFKKVQDKGAKMVIVVNTVSYYNRDDWENVPAMGYERDEKTSMQVISLSGYDGAALWDMIKSNKSTRSATIEPYRIDMKEFNKRKPKVGDMARLDLEFTDDLIEWKEEYQVPAGSTSWGPRTDLMLKPDLSAPGKNIYSTLNKINGKDDYAYMSGTSMATPVAAGASVIIRPKLKSMESKLPSGANIDLASLTKIVMQNSATPMVDPSTAKNKDITTALFASPRQQGAGVINVSRALKQDVIGAYKVKDSVGEINSYGSISLKEIRGGSKNFTIDLYNTSDKDVTFEISSSPVTTDSEKNVIKLDEEYKDENSSDGKQIVAEIHPKEVDGAKIEFSKDKVVVPAKSYVALDATLYTGALADEDKFIESFIKFTPLDSDISAISMPLMGFAGDWNKEPIIDKWAWEEGSLSGKITVFDDNGKPKRPGTLNYGAGGEHGVDNFHPAGVIQNLEGGNPNFKQDSSYFSMNTAVDLTKSKSSNSELISGKKKKIKIVNQAGNEKEVDANDFEVNNAGLTPSPLVLRSASDSKIYIANENHENLRTMAVQHFVRGILNSKRNTAKGLKDGFKKVWGDLKWDGTVFNPHHNASGSIQGDLEQVAEGQYYYTFEYRLTPDYPWQKTEIPIKIDNTPPTIEKIDLDDLDNIKVYAKDTFHKAKDLSKQKNGVYFITEQNEEDFEEVENRVWYVGAGFVDNASGRVIKDLDVIRTSEGEYEIRDANQGLKGKTLEIVAVDGAGNFAPTVRVVFDEEGKNYTIQGYDGKTNKYDDKGKGNIDSSKLKPEKKVNPVSPVNPGYGKVKRVSGKPTITIEKDVSALGRVENAKLPKEKTFNNVTVVDLETYGTKEVSEFKSKGNDCTIKDSDGNPIYYDVVKYDGKLYHTKALEEEDPVEFYWDEAAEDKKGVENYAKEKNVTLFKMEYDTITEEDLEKMGKYKVDLNESDGFTVIGKIENADRFTRLYFQSKEMKSASKTKEIPTFDYNEDENTLRFDFYGNRKDSNTGSNPFNYDGGEIYIYAVNGSEKSDILTLTMPDAKKNAPEDPYLGSDDHNSYTTDLANIVEFKANGKNGVAHKENDTLEIDAVPADKTITNPDTKIEYPLYHLKDRLKVRKGYALRIISYNAGKMSMTPLSDVIYAEDPAKMKSSEWTTFGSKGKSGYYYINVNILQGFNALRYEIYKPDCDSDGNFINVTKDSKNNITSIPEDKMIFEKGRCVYFDKDPVIFNLDKDTFNPYLGSTSDTPIIFTRTNPMTVRGTIGDKGGFMWHLRINHHIIDEYLIYGDLKVDNTRDFTFTTDVEDGDIFDIGVKDYSGNGFPEKEYVGKDGNKFTRQMPDKYKVIIDDVKPKIEVANDSSLSDPTFTLSSSTTASVLQIKITDETKNGLTGVLQEKRVSLNGSEITSGSHTISEEPTVDKPWEITISATDYAGNKSTMKYTYNGKDLNKINIPVINVKFDLDGGEGYLFDNSNEIDVNKGEDLFLPYLTNITPPSGKEFDHFEIVENSSTFDKYPGDIIDISDETNVKVIWKDKAIKEKYKITFDLNGGSGVLEKKIVEIEKGEKYSLPDGKAQAEKAGYDFKGWKINGKNYSTFDEIVVLNDMELVAIWEKTGTKKPDKNEESKPSGGSSHSGGGGSSHSGGGGSSHSGGGGSSSSKKNNTQSETTPTTPTTSKTNPTTPTTSKTTLTKEQVGKILSAKAKDVDPNNWAAKSIANVLKRNIMTGMGNNEFKPLNNIRRSEVAQIIYNMNNREEVVNPIRISDVKEGSWYYDACNFVIGKKLMVGYKDGRFMPDNNIKRIEFMYVIGRGLNIAEVSNEEASKILSKFQDKDKIPSWARNLVAGVVKSGIVEGDGKNIKPNDFITRQEAAAILSKI